MIEIKRAEKCTETRKKNLMEFWNQARIIKKKTEKKLKKLNHPKWKYTTMKNKQNK